MNIKGIIKEEIDDWGWADDIPNNFTPTPNTLYHFLPNLPITSAMVSAFFNYTGNYGIKTGNNTTWLTQYKDEGVKLVYITTNSDGKVYGHQTNSSNINGEWSMDMINKQNYLDNSIDGYTVFPFSKPINESDDLQWMDDISPLDAKVSFTDMINMLEGIFHSTKYYIEDYGGQFDISDNTGTYSGYDGSSTNQEISINEILSELTTDGMNVSATIKIEYNELEKLIRNHFSITESDDLDWIRDVTPVPKSVIIDRDNSNIDVMEFLDNNGYSWASGTEIYTDTGNLIFEPHRYILVGPAYNDIFNVKENRIQHINDLELLYDIHPHYRSMDVITL